MSGGRAAFTRWRRAAAAGCLLLLAAARPSAPPHDLHVAHTRMVVEGAVVVARVRMFRDDLQKALKQPITDDSASRRAVAAYVRQNLLLTADGAALAGDVLDAGGDTDAGQPIWWVIVQWKAARPVKSLGVKAQLMFDTFADQQNLVLVARQPGDERRSLYFQGGDRKEQVLTF